MRTAGPSKPEMSSDLERKCAERDELLNWLQTLERGNAAPEAKIIVQAQLDRVLRDVRRLEEQAG